MSPYGQSRSALALIGGAGTMLMIGVIERYIRRRVRQPAALSATAHALAADRSSD